MSDAVGQSGDGGRPQVVALTGFMGSGKTTVGRALAKLLVWEFVDLDAMIEAREGRAIREIFRSEGEAEFRQIEQAALRECLAGCVHPTVIALGGGTFVSVRNKRLLHEARACSIFLEVPVEELLSRCANSAEGEASNPRPLAGDSKEFRRLQEERLPWYRRANLTIDASGKTAEEIAREIAELLRRRIAK